jgi:hypothetical protein
MQIRIEKENYEEKYKLGLQGEKSELRRRLQTRVKRGKG